MTFLEYLDDLWVTKYECNDGALIVGATSTLLPVCFAVITDLLVNKQRLFMIKAFNEKPAIFTKPIAQDKWTHECLIAAANQSDDIINWLKQSITIHSKASSDIN